MLTLIFADVDRCRDALASVRSRTEGMKCKGTMLNEDPKREMGRMPKLRWVNWGTDRYIYSG